ncbi:Adenylosuccinate synthetase (IMP--aspartate ligase) (AdSS) (AMPSase) [Thermococcus onnurineus NA1]|uniref:Adenylosuccinate synthetase n=1 Tax=Thermococcus onnurineus (strain NA1) TaxID=523850 RepID=PURA_THEON|nr:adenylosuccinate synthetase [Thermococcus onnurineus]B6YWD6.1 RecName: Full=Adenylosuccinate synthetase; Short=AMPSase; Short=AdSS; AltName: Full=IMP--aspartate ligase [Thermococcus onnurineus NA1]ACJ16399.1 Adenylosuccinate synthetase (IMP--aspartate ligase) (AdSS) (AMPSase) [Thermococcus onnurineus NA1]
MPSYIVVGGQWGDEGKGSLIAYLALKDEPQIIARGGVGTNAGHSVFINGRKYAVRQLPTGFMQTKARLLVGAGVLVDPGVFFHELEHLKEFNVAERVGIDYRCAIIEPRHKERDRASSYLHDKIGTTGSGCGPANADRVMRMAKQAKDIKELEPYLTDVAQEINDALDEGKLVLIEGTQGFGLSLYYGTYPYVTSKDTTASAIASDVGIGPTRVDDVIVVFKSFPTRVGEGPFPTEMSAEEAERLGLVEYGTVTGRRRRVGWFDFEFARYSARLNGATMLAITMLDKYDKGAFGVTDYDKLPRKAKEFIEEIEERVGIPVGIIKTGPELEHVIDRRDTL